MNFSKSVGLVLFFCISYLSLQAQVQFTVDKIYFPGEHIGAISVGSKGIWAVKGSDSLGLGMIDHNGAVSDYSLQVRSFTNKPLMYTVGKYNNNAMLATEDKLMWFKDGVVSELDEEETGIQGNKVLGLEGDEGYTRVLTDSNDYTSYDNSSFLGRPGFSLIKDPLKISGTSLIYLNEGGMCSSESLVYRILSRTDAMTFEVDIPYSSVSQIHDLELGLPESSMLTVFVAHPKGLITIPFSNCRYRKSFLQDTAVFSLKRYGENMLIGTEKGLFYCLAGYPTKVEFIPLSVGDVKVFSIELEETKGILWIGTDKGLIQLKSNKNITSNDFILQPEWARTISGLDDDRVNAITTDKEGNIVVTGYYQRTCNFGDSTLDASNSDDFFIAQYSAKGKFKWLRSATTTKAPGYKLNEHGEAVVTDSEGNIYALVFSNIYGDLTPGSYSILIGSEAIQMDREKSNPIIIKYDKNGNLLWAKPISDINFSYPNKTTLKTDEENNVYLSLNSAIIKMDNTGSIIWSKAYPALSEMAAGKGGRIYIAGKFNQQLDFGNVHLNSGMNDSFYVLYLNKNGDAITGNYFANEGNEQNSNSGSIVGISCDETGYIYVSGFQYGTLKFGDITVIPETIDHNEFLTKLDPLGKFVWAKKIGGISLEPGIKTTSEGFSVIRGTFKGEFPEANINLPYSGDFNSYQYFIKFDPDGNIVWFKPFGGSAVSTMYNYYNPNTYCLDRDENIIAFLTYDKNLKVDGKEYESVGKTDALLFKIADTLSSNLNIVRGRIYNDANLNSKIDTGEEGVGGLIFKAMPGEYYSQSDAAGKYLLYLPKGSYTIQQVIPEQIGILMEQTYPLSNGIYSIELPGYRKDTSGFDFANKVTITPFIKVDINSIRRRRCFKGATTVQYCNQGFETAKDVKIKVEFPEHVIPISSNFPWTSIKGKEIVYAVGDVAPGYCNLITITDSVACDDVSILGLTQCTKAVISPSNKVIPINPNWDKADLQITGICKDNGYIRVVLKNKGDGQMSDSTQFRIFLDTTIVYKKNYKLLSGDSISLNIPVNGKSLRAEADQTTFHPLDHPATLTMEGCRGDEGMVISKGFVNQFAPNDDEEEVEISCSQVIGSFDPNDKQVVPSGITENHNIEEGTELEYILRFQNTGSDTAFTVVVKDTLSELLDITTFKPGVTSHNCTWNISGKVNPVITCRFNNINLPDSTTNEPGSHGFIKFKIHHKENIKGQQIKNKGYIYFDYNDPVITNEVVSTIGLPEFPEKLVVLQRCNTSLAQTDDSLYVHLCDLPEAEVRYIKSDSAYSKWQIVKGTGEIYEFDNKTRISNIGFGDNLYILQNQYCDLKWNKKVLIQRYPTPESPKSKEVTYCEGSLLDSVYVEGKNIKWYEASNSPTEIAKGNRFLPPYGTSETYYINQSDHDCESNFSPVYINYKLLPEPPKTADKVFCINENPKNVEALGNNILWYADTLTYKKIGEGTTLAIKSLNSGDSLTIYATQTMNGCESKSSAAFVYVKPFNLNEVFIPNLLTSGSNQYFSLPHFTTNECVGVFQSVQIFDLNGRQVFYSEDEKFYWKPEDTKNKMFLYHIKFSDQIYKGKLFVGY